MKNLIYTRYNFFQTLVLSCLFSLFILMMRIKITHEFHYLFLVWNLFLALLPLGIAWFIRFNPKLGKIATAFGIGLWLAFLPNAPYILTDVIHLKDTPHALLLLDSVMLFSFAITGLLACFQSLTEIRGVLSTWLSPQKLNYFTVIVLFLCAFGIHLGRFLRYNTWDVITNPKDVFTDCWSLIANPSQNLMEWLFMICLGLFLNLAYFLNTELKKQFV